MSDSIVTALLVPVFPSVHQIHKRPVFQLHLVFLDSLADGVTRFLVGIVHRLHTPLGEAVTVSAGIHVHAARHGTARHILACLAELADGYVKSFQPVRIVD